MLILGNFSRWSRWALVQVCLFWHCGGNGQPPPTPLGPPPAQLAPSAQEDKEGFHRVAPVPLPRLGFHEATEPVEAEVRCGWPHLCSLGFTNGFSLGVSLGQTVQSFFLPLVKPGRWMALDVSMGYQLYQDSDQGTWTSAHVGFSNFSYQDSQRRGGESQSFHLWVAHAQEVTPTYTQGLIFRIEQSSQKLMGMDPLGDNSPQGHDTRKALEHFIWLSRAHPYISLIFPGDVEVANWSPHDVDLPEPLRLYGRIAPFYQEAATGESAIYHMRERLFGLQLGSRLVYAPLDRGVAGRWAFMAGLGGSLQGSFLQQKSKVGEQPVRFSKRSWWDWNTDVAVAYQF